MAIKKNIVENSLLLPNSDCDKVYSSLSSHQPTAVATTPSTSTFASAPSISHLDSEAGASTAPTIISSATNISFGSDFSRSHSKDRFHSRCSLLYFCSYIAIYIVYLSLGGAIFEYLETENEISMRVTMKDIKSEFLKNHPDVSKDELNKLVDEMTKYSNYGITDNYDENELNWCFNKAVFFSVTLINTIGYGHITPMTKNGKLFSMMYAIIGIPLSLLLISTAVRRLMNFINVFYWLMEYMFARLCRTFAIKLMHFAIIVAISSTLFLIIPAFIFEHIEEDWNYLDAFYFCFVSVSTIGLGDYVPGENLKQSYENKVIYRLFIGLYLVLGIISIMVILNLFSRIEELNCGSLLVPPEKKNVFRLAKNNSTTTDVSAKVSPKHQRTDKIVREYV